MTQLQAPPRALPGDMVVGVELFALGLFKKLVLADRAAYHVDLVFGGPKDNSPEAIFFGVFLFSKKKELRKKLSYFLYILKEMSLFRYFLFLLGWYALFVPV